MFNKNLVCIKFSPGHSSEEEFNRQASYFVYVNLRKVRLRGCSRTAYIRACKKFIDQEEGRKIKMMLPERDFNNKPIYKNRNEAVMKLITDYLRFHEVGTVGPFR